MAVTARRPSFAVFMGCKEVETKEHTERLNDQLEGVEQEVVIGEGKIWEVIFNLIARADAI
jgi:hypothetical protein